MEHFLRLACALLLVISLAGAAAARDPRITTSGPEPYVKVPVVNSATDILAGPIAAEANVKAKPKITIQKSPPKQKLKEGETAEWTITVTNTGNVELVWISVTDDLAPDCNYPKEKPEKMFDPRLKPGESFTYTCTKEKVTKSFTNVAVVRAQGPSPKASEWFKEYKATSNKAYVTVPKFFPPPDLK